MPDGPAWGPPAGSVSVSLPEALPPTRAAAADTADRPLRLDPPVEDRLEGDADSGDASPPSPSSCSTPPPFKPPVSTCVPPLGSLLEMLTISSLFFSLFGPARSRECSSFPSNINRGPNDVNHRKLARALAARSTSEAVGPERRQRPSSDLRRSPAPAKDRPSRATRLLASESTPRGDILALQPVHRSRWTACRRGSAAPPTMVLEENVRVSCISLPALLGGKAAWRLQEALLRRAIAINPKCPVGHWQLSGYLAYICDCRGAERHYRQAFDLNASPGTVWCRWWWRGRS